MPGRRWPKLPPAPARLDNGDVSKGIGERLREARSARGLGFGEIEAQTKIRARYLRAMEDEQWDVLPGAAYARAFLHTYAEVLGLDADEVVADYRRVEQPTEEHAVVAPVQEGPVAEHRGPRLPAATVPRPGPLGIAAVAVLAVLGVVLVLGLATGSDDDGGEPARSPARGEGGEGSGGAPRERETEQPPDRVELRLTTTGTVWVCVIDQAGQPVVEGVTLPAGEKQGPFRGRSFEVGLGNGQVELRANGEPVEVPAVAEPIGYRLTPEGTRELDEGDRPTCT